MDVAVIHLQLFFPEPTSFRTMRRDTALQGNVPYAQELCPLLPHMILNGLLFLQAITK